MVNKTYRLLTKIGEGSFSKIFRAQHKDTGHQVAIKLVKAAHHAIYENELAMYAKLAEKTHIPSLFAAGIEGPYFFLAIDLYDQNLEQLRASFGAMPLKVVLQLGLQMLTIIESLHQKGVLHRDIKPANFMLKTNAQNISELFLIDLGLAGCFKDVNQKHIQMKTDERLMGTPRYMSVNTHQRLTSSRRDDLESLGYILVYLHKGELPWQGLNADGGGGDGGGELALSIKQSFGWAYANSMLGEFILFIQYCRNLKFAEEPHYDYLRTLLTNLAKII